jgi:PAS domain S-box-containing protein
MGFLLNRRAHFDPRVLQTLIAAIASAAAAEAAFTRYLGVHGPANLVGHLFLFLSAFLLFRAIVITGIKEPAALLFRDLELSQAALKNSEERLRFTLETCHIGAWDFDMVNHTVYRTLEHDRIFGYAELLPQWTLEMFLQHTLPEYRAEVAALVGEATAARSSGTYECRIRRADGEIRWIWLSGQHRIDLAGRSRVAGIVQDITERKQAEEQLRETVSELQAANTALDESRRIAINLMNEAFAARRQAEEAVAGLRQSNEDLSRLNRGMVGRELRMIELKEEVNAFCAQTGQPPRYPRDTGKALL